MHTLRLRQMVIKATCLMALGLLAMAAGAQVPQEMRSAIPGNTGILVAMPSVDGTFGRAIDFLRASGGENVPASAHEALGHFLSLNLDAAGGSGIATGAPMLLALGNDMSTNVRLFSLTDPAAFTRTIAANGYVEQQGTPGLWMSQSSYPAAGVMVRGSTAALMHSRSGDFSALTAPGGSALTNTLTLPPYGSAEILIDLAGLVEANRPRIEPILGMLDMMATMAQQPPQEGAPAGMPPMMGGVMGMYSQMFRSLLDGTAQVDHLAITVTPDSTALRARSTLVFRDGAAALASIPRHMPIDQALAGSLPSGNAVMRMVGSWDSERDPDCMARMATMFMQVVPNDPESQAAAQQFADMSRRYYEGTSRGWAMGMYPNPAGGFMPSTAMVFGSTDPQAMMDVMMEMFNHPAMGQMMTSLYGISPDAFGIEDLGTQSIGGIEARHIRFTGMDQMMSQIMIAEGQTPNPELLQAMGALDYWFAASGSTMIMTTEAQPAMLGQILAGGGESLTPPSNAADIAQGADVIGHMRLGALLDWMASSTATFAPPGQGPPFAAMAAALEGHETGIWGSFTALQGNEIGGAIFIPAADIAAMVGAAKAASN